MEMMKPEVELQSNNIRSTIVVFGSARAADPDQDPDSPLAKYYGEARKFAALASDAHAKSIDLNITLPHEQHPNAYLTPELCFLVPLFRHPQDALPDARPRHGHLPMASAPWMRCSKRSRSSRPIRLHLSRSYCSVRTLAQNRKLRGNGRRRSDFGGKTRSLHLCGDGGVRLEHDM